MKWMSIVILSLCLVLSCSCQCEDKHDLELKCGQVRMLPMDANTPEIWYGLWKTKGLLTQNISAEKDMKEIRKLLKENEKSIKKMKRELKKKMEKEKKQCQFSI